MKQEWTLTAEQWRQHILEECDRRIEKLKTSTSPIPGNLTRAKDHSADRVASRNADSYGRILAVENYKKEIAGWPDSELNRLHTAMIEKAIMRGEEIPEGILERHEPEIERRIAAFWESDDADGVEDTLESVFTVWHDEKERKVASRALCAFRMTRAYARRDFRQVALMKEVGTP